MTQTNIMQAVQNLVQPRAPRLKTFFDLVKPCIAQSTFSERNYVETRHFLKDASGHDINPTELTNYLEREYKRNLKDEIHWFMESNYQPEPDRYYKKINSLAYRTITTQRDLESLKSWERIRKLEGKELAEAIRLTRTPLSEPVGEIEADITEEERYALRTAHYLRTVSGLKENVIRKLEPAMLEMHQRASDWQPVPRNILDMTDGQEIALNRINALHRLHQSINEPLMVAYYPTLKHYREGREVRTKLGRYLTTFKNLLELSESNIRDIVNRWNGFVLGNDSWALNFIASTDKAGWLRVYRSERVRSCMQGSDAVTVYAHDKSTVRLAYLTDEEGEIIARAIVRESPADEKGWLRIYPAPDQSSEGKTLQARLEAEGYTKRINLDGCLLDAEEHPDHSDIYKCPYIDSGEGGNSKGEIVTIDGEEYIQIGKEDGDGTDCYLQQTNGWTDDIPEDYEYYCDDCGDGIDEGDAIGIGYHQDRGVICQCCSDNYREAIGRNGRRYWLHADECSYIDSQNDYYADEYLSENDIFECEYSNEYHHLDDLVHTSWGYIHTDYATSLDHADEDGNDWVHIDDAHTLSDGTVCHKDDAERLQANIDEQTEQEEMTA